MTSCPVADFSHKTAGTHCSDSYLTSNVDPVDSAADTDSDAVGDVDAVEGVVPDIEIVVGVVGVVGVGDVGTVAVADAVAPVEAAVEFVERTEDFGYVVEVSVADIDTDHDVETVVDIELGVCCIFEGVTINSTLRDILVKYRTIQRLVENNRTQTMVIHSGYA